MATSKRATNAEMEERAEFIHRLLDLGLSRSSILVQITKRFDLSRAQGYKELARISSDRQSDGVDLPNLKGTEAMKEAIGLLHSAMIDCTIDGEFKELTKISKELREMSRGLGIGAALGGAQPNGSEAVGITDSDQQIDPPIEVVAASAAMKKVS